MLSEKDIVYVTKKQASITTVLLALFCLLIFILGYFLGKQSSIEEFGQKVAQDSINDRVDYIQMMQSFAEKTKSDDDVQVDKDAVVTMAQEQELVSGETVEEESAPIVSNSKKEVSNKKHHAILIGFGSKATAMQFVQRLKDHNIEVEIKTKVSKSASGKIRKNWYQVVTKSYDSRQDVQQVVNKIREFERLKPSDIKII